MSANQSVATDMLQKTITEEETRETAANMIWLAGCAVNRIRPDRGRAEQMNLESVYKMCEFHSLTALCCMAVEEAHGGKLPESSISAEWTEAKNRAIYKTIRFDAERGEVLSFLEKSGIWYMPLKGVLLKELYPKVGMREMADNDILFDRNHEEQVHEWFLNRGYESESYRKTFENSYHKKPFFNFEMHTSLFNAMSYPEWSAYFGNVKERLVPKPETEYGYQFTDEDFYIYFLVHAYKHVKYSGTGIRSLLDCYLYTNAKKDMDWTYIYGEMEKLEIVSFEKKFRNLSNRVFSDPVSFSMECLSDDEKNFLNSFIFSGTYGTVKNQICNRMKEMNIDTGELNGDTKKKYLLRRLFPNEEFMKKYYPFFGRHKWLIPVGYIYRMFSMVIKSKKKTITEVRNLWRI